MDINSGGSGTMPDPGRSYALSLKKYDLALGPACDIEMGTSPF